MLDIQELRKDLDGVVSQLKRRGYEFNFEIFTKVENERKVVQTRTQELQAKRNNASKQIGIAKAKGEDTSAIMVEVAGLEDWSKETLAERPCQVVLESGRALESVLSAPWTARDYLRSVGTALQGSCVAAGRVPGRGYPDSAGRHGKGQRTWIRGSDALLSSGAGRRFGAQRRSRRRIEFDRR